MPLGRAALQSGTSACEECAPGPEPRQAECPRFSASKIGRNRTSSRSLRKRSNDQAPRRRPVVLDDAADEKPWGVGRAGAKDRSSERRRGRSRTLADTTRSDGVQGDSPQSFGNGSGDRCTECRSGLDVTATADRRARCRRFVAAVASGLRAGSSQQLREGGRGTATGGDVTLWMASSESQQPCWSVAEIVQRGLSSRNVLHLCELRQGTSTR